MNSQPQKKNRLKSIFYEISSTELIARIGVFGTFIGHGIVAISVNPKWIPLLTGFDLTREQALFLMPFIGILDIIVAVIILLYPIRIVLFWALFWAFLTALSRPISGDSILELLERSSNWCLPLVLIMIRYYENKKIKKNKKNFFINQ